MVLQIFLNVLIVNILTILVVHKRMSTMTKIDRSTYAGYGNKTTKSTPSNFWVQRFIDKITLTIYPTASSSAAGANNKLKLFYTKRIEDAGVFTNATNIPYRFVPCMTAGLSFYLSQKFAPQRSQEMKLFYEDELARALAEDGSASSTFITPKTQQLRRIIQQCT